MAGVLYSWGDEMHQPISHLTYRAITDHLAIVRNDVGAIVDIVVIPKHLDRTIAKQTSSIVREALIRMLDHAQDVAERRREQSINE